MADYGDVSGGNSDQAIRDIVAQLQGSPTDAQVAAAPQSGTGVMLPAPEVTPTMQYVAPADPAAAPQAAAPQPAPAASQTINVGGYAMPQIGDPSQYVPATNPGPPMVITPTLPATRPTKADDWTAPVPTMTPPPVAAVPAAPVMGRIAGVQPQAVPTMGSLMVRRGQ